MTYISRDPISVDRLLAEVSSAERGGLCLFLGSVRSGAGVGNPGASPRGQSTREPGGPGNPGASPRGQPTREPGGPGNPGASPRGQSTLSAIEYSAYPEMVEAEFDRILADARERWPEARIAVRHRMGVIPAGEASIAIAAAAPHRAEAFDACRYVIEEVKRRLPIWKKELRVDGTTVWVDPHGHPVEAGPR